MKKPAIVLSFPALMLAARFIPLDRLPITCVLLSLTGCPCPTCGMTRSVIALAHLSIAKAVRFNALGPILVVLLALCWCNSVYEVFSNRRTALSIWAGRNVLFLAAVGFALLLVFGAARIWLLIHG